MINKNDFHVFTVFEDTIMALPSGEAYIIDTLASELLKSGATTKEEALAKLSESFDEAHIKKAYTELEKILSDRIKDHSTDNPHRLLRALCLNITHKCNLSCDYCFASHLTGSCAGSMSEDIVKSSFDFLFESSKDVKRLQVDFFGGEPLLNFNEVKNGVKYARTLEERTGKKVLFTLTTNATLLTDEIIDFIKQENFSLVLSLDGSKEINDKHRPFKNGPGSFDKTIENIRKIRDKFDKNDYYIRGTFTAETLDIQETLKFYLDEGFYNVSLEPVNAPENSSYAIRDEHIGTLSESYNRAAKWMVDKPMKFFHFNLETDNPLCLTRRITGCGAGVEYMAVDPDGFLYPCHQFIGDDKFKIGDVKNGISGRDVIEKFRNSTIYTKEECPNCWGRFYCGGGCHYQQHVRTGNIDKPSKLYCNIFKKRLESALWFNISRRILA